MSPTVIVIIVLAAVAGAAALAFVIGRASKPAAIPESEAEKQRVLAAARTDADGIKREAGVQAKETAQKIRAEADAGRSGRGGRSSTVKQPSCRPKGRRSSGRDRDLKGERDEIARKEKQLQSREQAAEAAARSAAAQATEAKARLEKIAGLSPAEARKLLENEVREEARREAAAEVKRIEDEARAEAAEKARMVIAAAIQRHASEYVAERTVSVVPLPSDDMKGRIIGREGRNIRALEAATGIDLIIDDTPEAVVISCFNPVRREIARLALTRLIADGRIHPSRIEEMVEKATEEVERQCQEAGEQAAFDLGIGRRAPGADEAARQAEVPLEQRAELAAALDRGRASSRGPWRLSWG